MRNFRFYAYCVGLLLVTFNLWLIGRDSLSNLIDTPFLSLSQIFALWGVVFLGFELILVTRLKFLEFFLGPLDKIYGYHRYLGIFSMLSILIHAMGLIFDAASIGQSPLPYVLPDAGNLTYSAGIISLYMMISIILSSIYIRLPYKIWKNVHRILSLSVVFAVYHILTIPSDISQNAPLKVFVVGVLFAGVASMGYKVFAYKYLAPKYEYKVTSVEESKEHIVINMAPFGNKLNFIAGQFAYFSFLSENVTDEEHPFSILSRPGSNELRIGVKKVGEYTKSLVNLAYGDRVSVRGAHGAFGEERRGSAKEVWLAAGIGITPIISMKPAMNTKLYYLLRDPKNDLFLEDLLKTQQQHDDFEVAIHSSELGVRFDFNRLKEEGLDLKTTIMRVCAPKSIIEEVRKLYISNGYPLNNLVYEDFDLFD